MSQGSWGYDDTHSGYREGGLERQHHEGGTVRRAWRQKRTAVWGGVLAGALIAGLARPPIAATPSPPPGAPAVESAPSSLTGLSPVLPTSVIAASAAPGSTWHAQRAVYGT